MIGESKRARARLIRDIRKNKNLYEPDFSEILVLVTRVDTTSPLGTPPAFLEQVRTDIRDLELNAFLLDDLMNSKSLNYPLEDITRVCNAVVFVCLGSGSTRHASDVQRILSQLSPQSGIDYPIERRAIFFLEDTVDSNYQNQIEQEWGRPNEFQQLSEISREVYWGVQDIIGWEKDGTLPLPPGSRRSLRGNW